MSFQELHICALEDQIMNLTRDCYYLMSLLNTEDNIDWDSWEQGRKIKEDLERSKDFFDAIQRRQNSQNDYVQQHRAEEAARIQRERNENARKVSEQLKSERAQYASRKMKESKNDSENYARQQFFSPIETKGYEFVDYPTNDLVNRQHLRPRDVYWTWPVQRQEELEREARNEQRLAEERERNIKLESIWNGKKFDNVLFGHESFYDIEKFFDYLFHPIEF